MADLQLPEGFQLESGEEVINTGRDWGISLPLVLTTRRLIAPAEPSASQYVAIPLADISDVRLRNPHFGFTTVIVDYDDGLSASFAAHINAARIRRDIRQVWKRQIGEPLR